MLSILFSCVQDSTAVRAASLIDQLLHFFLFHINVVGERGVFQNKDERKEEVWKDGQAILNIASHLLSFLLDRRLLSLTDEMHHDDTTVRKIGKDKSVK